ncbi:hypothetical protein HDU88_003727 [Geranomyces variabilis]|nr:hypothetical protein HDU88_003727 [Geranomyces variabilis]
MVEAKAEMADHDAITSTIDDIAYEKGVHRLLLDCMPRDDHGDCKQASRFDSTNKAAYHSATVEQPELCAWPAKAELMNPGELMEFALMEPAVANDVMDTSPTADHLDEDALPEEDDDMTNLPTPEDQLLETCKGMKLADINQWSRVVMDRQDWKDVKALRKMLKKLSNAQPWTFDASRDPEQLQHLAPNRHFLVLRSGITPDPRRLKGLRLVPCDPGSRILLCAYDPVTGDVYLIGSEYGEWVRTMSELIDGLTSKKNKAINADKRVESAHKAYLARKEELATLRRTGKGTYSQWTKHSLPGEILGGSHNVVHWMYEHLKQLTIEVDRFADIGCKIRADVAREPQFLELAAKITMLRLQMKERVKEFHRFAASFLEAFDIVVLPRFDFEKITRRGGAGPQSTTKTVFTTLAHGGFYALLCRRLAFKGRRHLVPTEAFSSQACVFCGSLRKVGRGFIYKCTKCRNWWYRDANGAAMICLFVIIRAMDGLGL